MLFEKQSFVDANLEVVKVCEKCVVDACDHRKNTEVTGGREVLTSSYKEKFLQFGAHMLKRPCII